jgi:hypothetical protein
MLPDRSEERLEEGDDLRRTLTFTDRDDVQMLEFANEEIKQEDPS